MAELILTINARRGKAGATEFTVATDKVTKGATRAAAATGRLEKRMASAGKTGAVVGSQFRALFAGFTAIIALRAATKTIIEFEESMVVLKNVLRLTDDEALKPFIKTAKQLGATTRFTATEVGDGLLFLARAGFTASESLDAIGGTLNLATAGLLDLGAAADLASNVVSQFNLAAAETNRVGNDLVVVANRANTSVAQLGEALKFAGPIASLAGDSLEDTAAIIGVLGDAGIQGTLAGTGLRQSILRLVAPTAAAKKAIKGLTLELADVNPALVGSVEAFRALGKAELDVEAASAIFGARTAAVAAIAAQSTVKIDELRVAQEKNKIEAQLLAEELEATLGGAFRALGAATEGLFLRLGDEGLGGALESVVRGATSVIRVLAGVSVGGEIASTKVLAMAAAVKGLAAGLAVLVALKLAVVIGGWTKAMIGFNAAAAISPIGVITRLVAVAAGAWVLFSSNIDRARLAIEALGDAQEEERQRAGRFRLELAESLAKSDFAGMASSYRIEVEKIAELTLNAEASMESLLEARRSAALGPEELNPFKTVEDLNKLPLSALLPGSELQREIASRAIATAPLPETVFDVGGLPAAREAIEEYEEAALAALETQILLIDAIDRFRAPSAIDPGPFRQALGLEAKDELTAENLTQLGFKIGRGAVVAKFALQDIGPVLAALDKQAEDAAEAALNAALGIQKPLSDELLARERVLAVIKEEDRIKRLSPEQKLLEKFETRARAEFAIDRAEIPGAALEGADIDPITKRISVGKELSAQLLEEVRRQLALNEEAKNGLPVFEQTIKQLERQAQLQRIIAEGGELEGKIFSAQLAAGLDELTVITDPSKLQAVRDAVVDLQAAEDNLAVSRGESVSILETFLGALRDERELAKLSDVDRESELLQREALAAALEDQAAGREGTLIALNDEGKLTSDLVDELDELAAARVLDTNAQRDGLTQAEQTIQALQDQIALQRLTLTEARQLQEARAAGPDATREQLAIIDALVEQAEQAERIRATADQIANAFSRGFEDLIFEAESLRDVLKNLADDLSRLFLRQFALGPLSDLFSTGITNLFGGGTPAPGLNFAANPGLFGPGFQHGGVIEQPSLIVPLSGGRITPVSEAGPERVTPGRGDPDAASRSITLNQRFIINTPNADSFRQSSQQLLADAARRMRRELGSGVGT